MPKPMPPGRPLAWYLGALCAALLVPMLLLGGYLLLRMSHAERLRHEAVAEEAARRLAIALDRGLITYQAMLEVLATSDYLQSGNLDAFRRRVLEVRRPPGSEIVVRDAAGRTLAEIGPPWAALAVQRPPAEADHLTAATGRPQVSDLLPALGAAADPTFAVVAPVRDDAGRVQYLLGLVVPAAVLDDLLGQGEVPPGMIARLADRHGLVVAHSPGPVRGVGLRLPAATLDAMGGRPAGWLRTEADDGTPAVAAFAHSAVSGWVTLVSLPEAAFDAPLRRSLWIACGAGGLLALLAAGLALGFARRIAGPIEALAGVAADGAGAPLATPVREVNLVAQALAAAQAEGRRRATEREALLATLNCAQVMVRRPDGVITLWTAGMQRLFGWTRDQALGRGSHVLLRTRFPGPLAEIEARLLAEGEWRGELRHRRSDGVEVVVASHWALRRDTDGTALAVVEACNDITAWRQAEARLRDTQAELFRVARINAMEAMAAALAHELNQPLTAAVNFAEAARRMLACAPEVPPLPAARAAMAEAAGEVVRAGEILRSLRRFIGRGDTEQRPIALNPVLESATALALAGSPTLAVTLRFALAPGLPPVMADAVQLQQVVVNLVRNAVEAMSGAARRELLVATALDGDGIAISIADTGPGLDPDLAGRLFVPFISTKPDGLGFGLSISHSIVAAHGGRLEAAARPGGGTEFRFTLPTMDEALVEPGVEEAADAG